MLTPLASSAPIPWNDIPGVAVVGGVVGIVIIIAAIREMLRRK
jgi:hypothetical protein